MFAHILPIGSKKTLHRNVQEKEALSSRKIHDERNLVPNIIRNACDLIFKCKAPEKF